MYTLDANIFVRDANPHDPSHETCRDLLERLHAARLPIFEPAILLAEVAGPLSRTFRDPIRARLYAEAVSALPNLSLIAIDGEIAQLAAEIAADYALRGMDAIYIAIAYSYNCAFVTLDEEPRRRAGSLIRVLLPTEAIALL